LTAAATVTNNLKHVTNIYHAKKNSEPQGDVMPLQPYIGQIMPFAGPVVPSGWVACNGQLLSIAQNSALFSLLGTNYGGDGMRTFGLPDLRGRAILGASPTIVPGTTGGSVSVTLNVQQIPPHVHVIEASSTKGAGRGSTATGHLFGVNTEPTTNPTSIFATAGSGEVALQTGTNVANGGGGAAHNNMQPYLTISYLMATAGVYPSRN
jgi:microcystin-dependent protein